MTYVATINTVDPDHLADVVAEMAVRGAPVIRAIRDECQGLIVALEGSHRINAAMHLGLSPVWQMLADDDMLACADIGLDDCGTFDGETVHAADIRDYLAGPSGDYRGLPILRLED